jgi:Kef-type K+ transport system membrane component KefB
VMSVVLLVVLLSAMTTEILGIHALFGAFFAGVVMPRDAALRTRACERVEYVSELVLLPLFFALTGLRTQIGLLDQGYLWVVCGGIVALAVTGKLVGGALISRLASDLSWRESWLLGALLNTRGLMELVVLNIGYEMGILSPVIFTMLVLMALMTTVMTGPLIELLTARNHLGMVPSPAGDAVTAGEMT